VKNYFIYRDDDFQEFWNIEQADAQVTVWFGKLGTDGETQAKAYGSVRAAEKEAQKLIKQKVKMGYEQVSEDAAGEAMGEKKYALSYEDYEDKGRDQIWLGKKILEDKRLPELKSIIVGAWEETYEKSCQPILDFFVEHKESFQHIEGFFIGDMEYDECEVSWIIQGNYERFLNAFPNLKTLRIKGATNLELGALSHAGLRKLEIICGGLGEEVVRSVAEASLPNLESLILYIGVEDYGFNGGLNSLRPLLEKGRFPKLTELGLVDSDMEDEIVELVLASDILPQLKKLHFSYGSLTDKGGQMLLDHGDRLAHLELLDLEYHYLTEDMVERLEQLPVEINAANAQEPDEYGGEVYYYPMLTE